MIKLKKKKNQIREIMGVISGLVGFAFGGSFLIELNYLILSSRFPTIVGSYLRLYTQDYTHNSST